MEINFLDKTHQYKKPPHAIEKSPRPYFGWYCSITDGVNSNFRQTLYKTVAFEFLLTLDITVAFEFWHGRKDT